MIRSSANQSHDLEHASHRASSGLSPLGWNGIRAGSRRWFLQSGLAGLAGLGLSNSLAARAAERTPQADRKAVILFWLSGGPSHIDMWDPKPDAPAEIRGPYRSISTKIPGVQVCEHLPLQASILDKLSIIRSVDCSASNHTPITMQAGNPLARRTDDGRDGGGYPSMGSIAAKFRGSNDKSMPAFIGLADSWAADVWGAGHMGGSFEPVKGQDLLGRVAIPKGLKLERLSDRDGLRQQLDRFNRGLDRYQSMAQLDRYQHMAYDMLASGRVQQAFDVSAEPDALRDAYGRDSLGEKALLARRLVESGVTFVLVSGAWGYFDHHGDEVRWGGIAKGLTPLLPRVDGVMYTLIRDLLDRGILDRTLVLMMGEFGRSPVMTATAGRGHWTNVMSMLVAGGGLPCGQVIGSTDRKGYDIADARVTPSDLAATTFRHLGIDLNEHWIDPQGRPIPIVTEGGRPIPALL